VSHVFTCCSIVTFSHIGYACALLDSLKVHTQHSVTLYVLVVDSVLGFTIPQGMILVSLDDLGESGQLFRKKYSAAVHSELRWALKPVLMRYLLNLDGISSCIYLDHDLYFFDNYDFLFDQLEESAFLLTPHFRATTPSTDVNSFMITLRDGFFNAGLVGASSSGIVILEWWSQANLFACERNEAYQLFVDQRYLDFVPLIFENVHINEHRGINFSTWYASPKFAGSGLKTTVDGYPIVCVHFVAELPLVLTLEQDSKLAIWKSLLPYFEHYQKSLEQYSSWIIQKKSRWQSMAEEQLRWINQLERQQAELWQRVEAGNTQRNQLQHQIEALQAEHTALQVEHTALQAEHTALQAEHQAFRAYYRVLENRSVLGWLRKLKRFLNDHD
jgi:hypothetical protein